MDQVKAVIHTRMQGQRPMVDAVANALAVSPRSLQRRLTESGTSYQRLLDEVRRQIARELLGTTDLESGEIAFLLGFEEVNSFNRAFSAWGARRRCGGGNARMPPRCRSGGSSNPQALPAAQAEGASPIESKPR